MRPNVSKRTSVGKAVDMGLDPTDGKWVASCDLHSVFVINSSKRLADMSARNPAEWCDECREDAAAGPSSTKR